jgi:hypothetical protein
MTQVQITEREMPIMNEETELQRRAAHPKMRETCKKVLPDRKRVRNNGKSV